MWGTCDVLIIGAGVVGCAVARELSRYRIKVVVLEKECDVSAGTSGRNSAVIHAGFNNRPGSLMAKLCVEGSQGFEALCSELDVDYKRTGKYLIAFDERDLEILERLIRQGESNGVRGLRMVEPEEYRKIVPNAGGIGAMYSPETAIINQFQYAIALAQCAAQNGVRFCFDECVRGIEKNGNGYKIDMDSNFLSLYHLEDRAERYKHMVKILEASATMVLVMAFQLQFPVLSRRAVMGILKTDVCS